VTSSSGEDYSEWIAEVIVVPKLGVNDPQGEAIRGGLGSLGYSQVGSVRSGRFFRLEFTAADEDEAHAQATEMCDRLLANPVIETFSVSVHRAVHLDAIDRNDE